MNSRETKHSEQCCLQFTGHSNIEVIDSFFAGQKEADTLRNTGSFTFDKVFDQNSTQLEVFDEIGRDLVSSVVDGINSTLFVYGQTASGKTFTMQGPDITNDKMKGLIPRIIEYQFEKIDNSLETVEFTLNVSIFEIYMEKIRDLLNVGQKDLKIREDVVKGVFVENLTRVNVGELSEVMKLMMEANKNRIVASTKMNEQSSRSHLLFQLEVHQRNTEDQSVYTVLAGEMREVYFSRFGGQRESRQNWSRGKGIGRGQEDQPESIGSGEGDQRADGRQAGPRVLPVLNDHADTPRLFGRQQQDESDCHLLAVGLQRAGDHLDAQVRAKSQEYQEQTQSEPSVHSRRTAENSGA
jgi:hypothetical protein